MRHNLLVIIISLAVVLSLSAAGACAGLSPQVKAAPCEKSKAAHGGITEEAAGTCHMRTCMPGDGRLFLFSDTSSRRVTLEKRLAPVQSAIPMPDPKALVHARAGKVVFKAPSCIPPPLFVLHCALIC